MSTGRDDDALTWDGDDDPTLDIGAAAEAPTDPEHGPPPTLPPGYTAVGRGSASLSDPAAAAPVPPESPIDSAPEAPRGPMGSVELIAIGVLGGVYALFAIGWIIGGLRLQGWRPFLVTDAMYQGSLWLAVIAPLLWFATVFLLTRAVRAWVRVVWLLAGVVLLVPWPFVMIGAVGQ